MAKTTNDLLQGTLELLILRSLVSESRHGWGIQHRLEQISDNKLTIQHGSLYPALYRLEKDGLIKAKWAQTENNRRAKYYSLTPRGQRRLEKETALWAEFSAIVNLILLSN
jgi:transcriptional regulator